MVPRKPCTRRRVRLMRRASARRLTASGEDDCVPRTAWAGPGMTCTIVVVLAVPGLVVPAAVPVGGVPPPAGVGATGQPRVAAGPGAQGQRAWVFGTPAPAAAARGGGGPNAAPALGPG